jgi:c-di-GMP-binding flagellar brake protein YcgR
MWQDRRMESHVYDRLRVDDDAEVMTLLHACAATRAPCSVRAAGRPERYLSVLREIGDDGIAVLDPPRAPVIERALLPGTVASIELRLHDARVSFEARVARIAPRDGGPQLRLQRPDSLIRLQRRDAHRVRVPNDTTVRLTLDPSVPALSSVTLDELSIRRGALRVTGRRERLEAGALFERARLILPDGDEWPVAARIVHTAVLRRHADRADLRIGVQFVRPAPGFEAAVMRLVGGIARRAPVRARNVS